MLPELPEELLSHIFSYLALPSATNLADIADHRNGYNAKDEPLRKDMQLSQQTLFDVCLASRTLYRLAWPTLYRAYSAWPKRLSSMSPSLYLRTLCLKPEYGEALRSFSVRDQDDSNEEGMTMERLYNYQDFMAGDSMTMAVFQWRARSSWLTGYEGGQTFHDRLVRSLLIGMNDGITCMILLTCPNITELDISLPWDHRNSYLLADLFAVITSPQPEQSPSGSPYEPPSMRYVASRLFGTSWPDTQWQRPGVLEFLIECTLRSSVNTAWEPLLTHVTLLPSLKTLKVYNLIEGPSQDWLAAIIRRKAPQLRTLHLPECSLGDTSICDIVQLFPNLRTLKIDWNVMYNGFISMKEIGRAIARYIPQLVHLTLDASLCLAAEDSFDDDRRMSDTLCDSIKTMQFLKRLRINDQAIWSPLHIQNGADLEVEPGIRHILPVRVTWLEVVSPLRGPDMGWNDPSLYALYQSWQDRELRELLLDESFTELERLDIHNCERALYTSSVHERGWMHEVIETEGGIKVERLSWHKTNGELSVESRIQNGI